MFARHNGCRHCDRAHLRIGPVRLRRPHIRDLGHEGVILIGCWRHTNIVFAHPLDIGAEHLVGADPGIDPIGGYVGGLCKQVLQAFWVAHRDIQPDDAAVGPAHQINLVDLEVVEQRQIIR